MTIHFWHGLQQGPVLDSFTKIVHEWNLDHPESIDMSSGAPTPTQSSVALTHFSDYGAPARAALAASEEEQPQLVLAPEFMTSTMVQGVKGKKVIAIKTFLEDERLNAMADIVKKTFGDNEGTLTSLPLNPACGVLYTNKDLLRAIGKEPDYVPESLEALENICKQLLAKGLVESGYTSAWPPAYLIEIPAAQQNQPLVTPENGRQGHGDYLLSQPWLEQHFLDLRQQKKERVYQYAGRDNNARTPFIERKVAFFIQGSTHYDLLQREAKFAKEPFEVGCGPLPTLVRGQLEKFAFPLGGASIWVLNNQKTQEMIAGVRSFLNYLASREFQKRWHKETACVPVRKTLLSSDMLK